MLTRSMAAKLTAASASECLFVDFLSEIEPKKVSEALKHPGWVDAMQEELNQFYRNKVWTLVLLPYGKTAIDTKWVFRNKKDGHVAKMEAIKLFLAFATYMNLKVYQMDVKSAFLNGKLKEEVYVKQPPSFESSEFSDYVCKLDKALYGLKQALKACSLVKTPMVPPNNLGPDLVGKPANETAYRGMIGSLICEKNPQKSTSGACQILGGKLVYWSAKKLQSVAMSLAEAEYVVAASIRSSTGLDYNNGKYVAHPTPETVLDGNYSSTKQVKSIQQLLAYSLTTGTEGPEIPGALSKKSKSPKSKKPPTKTNVTPPKPTDGYEQSYSVSSSIVHDHQDLERNIKLASTDFPSTLDEGTRKSKHLPKSTATPPKDSWGNIQPLDKDITSMTSDKGTVKTMRCPEGTGAKYQVDQTQSTRLRAFLVSDEESEEDILGAGEEIDEEPQEKHEEAAVNYANLRASVDDYYDENIAHRDQTDKLVEASMSSLDKSSNTISDLYKGLNIITELLKEIKNAVKDDSVIKKISEATESFTKFSTNIINLQSSVNTLQAHALKQDEELSAWAKSSTNMAWNLGSRLSGLERAQNHIQSSMSSLKEDTHSIKNMMTEMYEVFKGQSSGSVTPTLALTHIPANVEGENATNTATKEPPSHTKGETGEPKRAIPISTIQPTKLEEDSSKKLVLASTIVRPDPDALIPYTINGELEVIKVVQEEAEKIGLDPKKITTAKVGEKFKKAQDAKHQVLKREHTKKVKKSLELRKHKFESYKWTINNKLKPKTITDIKIYPKTKPFVITVYRGTDGRNFDVHKPFAFGAFGISELDELREIIPKNKNKVVQELMNSLSQRYERIRKIPEELGIKSALPAPAPAPALEQASSKSSRKKRKHIELEPEVKIPRFECHRALPENVLFVNNMVIKEPEYGTFFIDEFSDKAFQRWIDIDKVGMEALVSYLVATSMVKSPKNARFSLKQKKLIVEHLDEEKLKSKKIKSWRRRQELHLAPSGLKRNGVTRLCDAITMANKEKPIVTSYMNRRSNSKLGTSFMDPKKQLCVRKNLTLISVHNILSFYEFAALEIKSKEMGEVDIDTLTMEHYMILGRCGRLDYLLEKAFIQKYCPPSRTTKQLEEIHNFKQEDNKTLCHAWESYNDHPFGCPTHELNNNQKLNGSNSSDGITTITNKLDNLGRDMRKLKESVHDIQVGCEICQGFQLDKDCPLKEDVKGVEEAKFREFRKPFSENGGDGSRYRVRPPGYYTRVDNLPPFGEKKPSLEETINKYFEESNKKQTANEEYMTKFRENTYLNLKKQDAAIKNMEVKVEQLT
ncbi:retrovirus-related pol polyprotein from transposon TNT 1-94 [Tanacetum coccineum]